MKGLLVVQQYFGLGDCIFGAQIATDYINEGYKVIWPVEPHFVEGLNRAYPHIMYVDRTKFNINYENKNFAVIDGMLHLPMRYSENLMGRPYKDHMRSKYEYLGKDWKTWVNTEPVIDKKKSNILYNAHGLTPKDKYNLIATNFGNSGRSIDIHVSNSFRDIYLKPIPEYSLFDWATIIRCATTIHAVSSSTLYLFELFDLLAQEVHLYPRKPVEQDFSYVDFVFTKQYVLHS